MLRLSIQLSLKRPDRNRCFQAHRQSPVLFFFKSTSKVRVLPSTGVTRAILAGEIKTAKTGEQPPIVYPIFVSDEPAVEATFMNAFFNEEFQTEGIVDARVKPLTVMSIDELEQTLCYVTDNDFSWRELLDSRFNEFGVYPNSVGHAIYALIVLKGLTAKQNPALKRKYDEFGDRMREIFQESSIADG